MSRYYRAPKTVVWTPPELCHAQERFLNSTSALYECHWTAIRPSQAVQLHCSSTLSSGHIGTAGRDDLLAIIFFRLILSFYCGSQRLVSLPTSEGRGSGVGGMWGM